MVNELIAMPSVCLNVNHSLRTPPAIDRMGSSATLEQAVSEHNVSASQDGPVEESGACSWSHNMKKILLGGSRSTALVLVLVWDC